MTHFFQLHQSLESRKDSIGRKKGELAWALVKKSESKLKERQRETSKWEKKIEKCDEEIAARDLRINENQTGGLRTKYTYLLSSVLTSQILLQNPFLKSE